MVDLAKLVVRLEAESSRLTTELEKANTKLSAFEKSSTSVMNSVKASLAGLAAAVSVDALTQSTKQALEFGDAIAKAADKVGLSTSALQELRFAAERTGVSQGALDTAMQRFSRRVGEVASGTGVLKDVFAQYDIQIQDSQGNMRSMESILSDYADAVAGAGNSQEQLRLAFKAFDAEGAALVNTLRNGSAGLNELRLQARNAGAVMDETLVRKAETMNDRWDALTTTIGVKFKSALITAADAGLQFFKIYNDLESTLRAIEETENRLVDAETRLSNSRGRNRAAAQRSKSQAEKDLDALREQEKVYRDIETRINALREGGAAVIPFDKNTKSKASSAADNKAADQIDEAQVIDYEKYRERLEQRTELLRKSLLTESELELERYDEKRTLLLEAYDQELVDKQTRDEMLQELEAQHQSKMQDIEYKSLSERQRFEQKTYKDKTKFVIGELINMTQGVAQQSRAMFEINKIAGTANAIINTYTGVTQALAAYPPPISFVMAAAQLAAGLAQVSAIQSTSFGSGTGSGVAPSLAATGATSTVATVSEQPPVLSAQNDSPSVTVQFLGDVYGLDDFEAVVLNTVKTAVTDKDQIIISADSRQAIELIG